MIPQLGEFIPKPARIIQPAGGTLRAAGFMLEPAVRKGPRPGANVPGAFAKGPESGRMTRYSFIIVGGTTGMLRGVARAARRSGDVGAWRPVNGETPERAISKTPPSYT